MSNAAKLSQDDLAEIIGIARDYLRGAVSDDDLRSWGSTRDFAEALVQISGTCVMGLPCERHGGAVHGLEAEALRRGVERILLDFDLSEHRDPPRGEQRFLRVLRDLLDGVDSRDSLSFLEVTAY
jgi:hypothetical protein